MGTFERFLGIVLLFKTEGVTTAGLGFIHIPSSSDRYSEGKKRRQVSPQNLLEDAEQGYYREGETPHGASLGGASLGAREAFGHCSLEIGVEGPCVYEQCN